MTPDRTGSKRLTLLAWFEKRFNITEIFSLLTSFGLFPAELDTGRPLRESFEEAIQRPMPSYARWPRVLGILAFLLFIFLGLTGVMLALYYRPTEAEAFGSVTTIVRDVPFGWFVHQVHGWAAQIFLLILIVRVARFYFQSMYKSPREALWIVVVLILVAASLADITGRLLVWDSQGYWNTVRALEILNALPVLGSLLSLLAGGQEIDSLTLIRFDVLHVLILPVVLLVLFHLHFSGVRRVGLSELPGQPRSGPAIYRVYLYNLLILIVLVFGGLITLATLIPAAFGSAADPMVTPPDARPPWYLLAPYAMMEMFPTFVPRWVRGFVLEGFLAVLIFLPFLDRSPWRPAGRRRFATALGVLVLLAAIVTAWLGYRLEVGS